MITVVGMGRKSGDLTMDGKEAIEQADIAVVKSARTHAAKTVEALQKHVVYCDDIFQSVGTFDDLNGAIVSRIRSLSKDKNIAFCVVGEGYDDTTVQRLRGEIRLIPGVPLYAPALGNKFISGSVIYNATELLGVQRIVAQPTVVKCIDDMYLADEVQLKLLSVFDPDTPVIFCHGSNIVRTQLSRLVQQSFDYQATLYIAPKPLAARQTFGYFDCQDILAVLCSKNGCPWDREQTHESIAKNVIEEAYELADAISKGETDHMVEELGDVLMQVLFHMQIARNEHEFFDDAVYSTLCRKLIDRHPHVFGDVKAKNSEQSLSVWEEQKKKEHGIKNTVQNVLDVPVGMSALMRSQKVSSRAAKGGYEFESVEQVAQKLSEELSEFLAANEQNKAMEGGDLLFACVNLLRLAGIDAETALLASTEKFVSRVTECERLLALRGENLQQMSAEQFDQLWSEAKGNVG